MTSVGAPSKKPRLSWRPAPSGALCASRSSAILGDHHPAEIEEERVYESEAFFPEQLEDTTQHSIGENVRRALKNSKLSENGLRNAIFTDLKRRHGAAFPASSSHQGSGMNLRGLRVRRDEQYKESNLKSLLAECYRSEGFPEERLLRGLNVTTTSLPDLAVLRGESLLFGEVKNDAKYSKAHASKQCALYLCALLYFLRVHMGVRARSVFGFCICGCRCSGIGPKKYAVCLVRLSAPTALGSSLLAQVFSKKCKTEDLSGVELLVRFLRCGKTLEVVGSSEPLVGASHRIPALLTLPEDLWADPSLVLNGTTSMVFKGDSDVISGHLKRFQLTGRDWRQFLFSTLDYLDRAEKKKSFYLKIRLKDTSLRPTPAISINALPDDQYDELYAVTPYGSDTVGVFLMNDCGTNINEETFVNTSFVTFCGLFSNLWRKTTSLCDKFFHGDVLPHNMVYNEATQELVLIDLDEGTKKANAPKRIIEDDGVLYAYLRYPNCLRGWEQALLYTQIQLVASFLLLTTLPCLVESMNQEHERFLDDLRRQADLANGYLESTDDNEPDDFSDESRSSTMILSNVVSALKGYLDSVSQ